MMKKFLKIFLTAFLIIMALLIIIPFAFKGRILEIARNEINKNLDARVEFSDMRLSLIRNFPNLSIRLTDLSVVGEGAFQYDTLVSLRSFRTVVDIKSIIMTDVIQIRSVILDQPRIKALVLSDGTVNWDIMKEPDDEIYEDEEPLEFRVQMHKFEIRDGYIDYDDLALEFRTTFGNTNLVMHGDLTQDFTSLDISATSELFNIWYDGIRYISNARFVVDTHLDADLNDFRFTFRDNEMMLNELALGMEGYFAMPEEDIDMDINFFSKKTDIKTILSLVPAIYMTEFEDLQTTGSLSLRGFVKGTLTDESMPSAGLDLVIENGTLNYPDLPGSITKMNMNLGVFYDGTDEDMTTVDLKNFEMEMAGNPFSMRLSIRTPASDMAVDLSASGTIDFTSLTDVIPLEDIIIRGLLESDLYFAGRMSDVENERYAELHAGGGLVLTAFQYSSTDFPLGISIPGARLDFSPRFVELTQFEAQAGNSDFRVSGRMENFIPYILNEGTLKGNMLFSSNLLDLNELLAGDSTQETDTFSLSLVEIPGNIDFVLASSIGRVLYDNLEISQVKGRIIVRDNRMVMEAVNMYMLEGAVMMNGEYNTSDMSAPFIDFSMNINDFDIPSSFIAFNTVRQLAPIAENLKGSYSASLQMHSLIDDNMMPVLTSMDARGRLRSSRVEIVTSETFNRLSSALRLREGRENILRDVDLSFTITKGRIYTEPFNIGLGPVNMLIGGDQGIDRTLNYVVKLTVPRSELGTGADQLINDLASRAAQRGINVQPAENINIDARITGTFSDPQISLDMRESARGAIDQLRDQIRDQAGREIERRVEEAEDRVREGVSEAAEKILREAQERANQIVSAAEDAAAAIRKEGEANAAKIEQQAAGRGRIAEAAAKRTADALRREASNNADALIREAGERAGKIIDDAKSEAEKL
jgi:vacuolar-type H+-ATPase subunit H